MSKKILIADDKTNNVDAISSSCAKRLRGAHCAMARGARAGRAWVLTCTPGRHDAAQQRVRSGVRRIRPQPAAYHTAHAVRKGRDAEVTGAVDGADLYVTKPFSTRELMVRIKGLLNPGARPAGVRATRSLTHASGKDVASQYPIGESDVLVVPRKRGLTLLAGAGLEGRSRARRLGAELGAATHTRCTGISN